MAHSIEVFVARLAPLRTAAGAVPVAELPQGFGLLPISRQVKKAFGGTEGEAPALPDLKELTAPLLSLVLRLSFDTPIAYLETEYFGGEGEQSAIVWEKGNLVLGPLKTDSASARQKPRQPGAINQALRYLGVVAEAGRDEFDSVGLRRYRFSEEWAEFAARGGAG